VTSKESPIMRRAISLSISLSLLSPLAPGRVGAQPGAPMESKTILVDGSSTVEPVTSAAVAEFAKLQPDVKLSVAVSGTSGGFRRFVVGETDMSNASRAIKAAEIEKASQEGIQYVESLVAFDGLTVAVDRETKVFKEGRPCLTVGELQLLWGREAEGLVTRWSQVGGRFADGPITLSGAASTSGTFDFFTDAVNKKEGDTRSDYFGTEEDQLLAEQTSQSPYALTYFGYAFYLNNQDRIQPVAIDPRSTAIDAPRDTLERLNALRQGNGKPPLANEPGACNGVLPDVDTIGSFAYQPLTRPLFVYTNVKSAQRKAVADFLGFYLSEKIVGNQEFMLDVGYVPITRRLREGARSCWDKRVTGTAFGGEFGGLTAREIAEKYTRHCKL
jgi:phosphate transport system substrate-binding protein